MAPDLRKGVEGGAGKPDGGGGLWGGAAQRRGRSQPGGGGLIAGGPVTGRGAGCEFSGEWLLVGLGFGARGFGFGLPGLWGLR